MIDFESSKTKELKLLHEVHKINSMNEQMLLKKMSESIHDTTLLQELNH